MMKRIIADLFLIVILSSCLAQSKSGKNSSAREQIDLTGTWRFKADLNNEGEAKGWFRPETDQIFWLAVRVPVAFDHCGAGMERYFGTGWFCRYVFVPESFRGRRIILHFEGINYNAKVWVNGIPVGENHDAFLPFEIPISDVVKIGRENYIAVSVSNIRQRGQFPLFEGWYGQGGFLREAYLEATNETYLNNTIMVASSIVGSERQKGRLSVMATVNNESEHTLPLNIQVRIADKSGKGLASFLSPLVSLDKKQVGHLSAAGDIPEVQWWSPDSPVLYKVEISLLKGTELLDKQVRFTGFRSIEVRDAQLLINGKPEYLLGFNRHEDSPRSGMAVDLEQAREDFKHMKEIGCNYVRLCHYPHHPGELDLCDELGLFVLAENAMNEWGHIDHPAPNPAIPLEPEDAPLVIENAKRSLTKMIFRDNHHPSIIIWSVSNENEESRDDISHGNDELIRFGQALDKSRLWTHVSNSFRKKGWENFYRFDDVITVNVYPTHWYSPTEDEIRAGLPESTRIMQDTLKRLHDKFPEKPIVVGEYGYPDGDTGEKGAQIQAVATEAEFKGLSAPYVAGGGIWCYARHPWPWYNMSNYGYVSRDRHTLFPALSIVEHLYKEYPKNRKKSRQ
ncbi:MAG: glycoside hydrolase family 2 TIM barrel-domain containing protein [Mangrovibacterium sp.]